MNPVDPEDQQSPAPILPIDEGTDGARNGAGAQTALLAMLKKRGMRALRDADPEPPAQEVVNPAAE